jgi:hypothetical protein
MSYTADYPIHEGYGISIFAQVEYDIEDASGDGWNEPREEAHAVVESVTLFRLEKKGKYRQCPNTWRPVFDGYAVIRTELGDAPAWVVDLIKSDTDWLTEQAADDGYDATDDWRDRLNDERLVEARS